MMPKAKNFFFLGYKFDAKSLKINFDYRIDFFNREPLDFTETIVLPRAPKNISQETLRKFLEPLHIILGISYYKLYCPPKIRLSFGLSKEQADFWNKVYRKGLGEFLYRNKLDPKKIARFPHAKIKTQSVDIEVTDRALLGIGGGKDSIVAAELLHDFSITSFAVETQREDRIFDEVMKKINKPSLKIKRFLDPKIFEAYEGEYNGHVPISAIFAFLGLFSAALYGYKNVIVGNEHSSNFGNIRYKGEIINHQWSKSAEFESMFQDYTKKYITPDIVYFSLLRPFHEIRVAQMFSKYKKYFPIFTSCNKNFTVSKERASFLWCGECPKCAFVYLMLAPFISKKELIDIFGKNLFANEKLLPLFRDLLGFGKLKPFDCVGTFEESQAALYLASKNYKNDVVMKVLLPGIKNPHYLVKQVFKTAPAPTLPAPFKFLGIKNVAILGYGREGKITEKYIRKNYPALKIGILDQNLDKNYLKKQGDYDLAIKTSGISKNKVKIHYTTATNIFFAQNKNFTIGVTGSKGKSTTASLIYEILKSSGKKVRLIGNIGNPMLEVKLSKVDPKEIFVIELSSYMLEDIEYSPNIAVTTNLFPEHMDYHGGVEKYYSAKKNIFKFQKTGGHSVKPPFNEKIPLDKSGIPLLGEHNLRNIQAAVKVARILKVADAAIKKAIKNFRSLPHRLEFVDEKNGIKFFDDAISTTPESTIAAVKSLKKIGTIFLGGEDRGYNFSELEKILRKYKIKNIVLFPDSGKRILKSRKGFNIFETKSMKSAVKFAFDNTEKGKICLLSTASPSYSLWKNFEEKGEEFKKYVRQATAS
ncbi:MAG: Mur ligase family protein [Candidatus Moranbacteria bacterium]|nr:Mur ligase family protein [Candidatus Moranbacteria bacterium]